METMITIIEYGGIIITTSVIIMILCAGLYWIAFILWYLILEDIYTFIKNKFFS